MQERGREWNNHHRRRSSSQISAKHTRHSIEAIDATLKPFDAQIEWSEPPQFPGGGTYRGLDGVKRYLNQSRAGWAEGSSEPERFVVAGNRIVVFVHARVRPKGSEKWNDVTLADVYTFRNGKAIQMRAFVDRQDALNWAGAEDSESIR